MNILGHFKTITKHKILVAKGCFRLGLYYQGTASPNNAERMANGYSKAWLHHKGRNKHHFEYWIDYSMDPRKKGLVGMKIPKRYMAEMFVDRVSAGKIYNGDKFTQESPLEYFNHGIGGTLMHDASREYLTKLLTMYAWEGEDAAFDYLKRDLKEDISGYDKISPKTETGCIHIG